MSTMAEDFRDRCDDLVVFMEKQRDELDMLRVYTSNFCTRVAGEGSLGRGNRCILAKDHDGACVFGQLQVSEMRDDPVALKAENEEMKQKLYSIVTAVHSCDGECTAHGCSAFKNPEAAVRQTVGDLTKMINTERRCNDNRRMELAMRLGIGPSFCKTTDWPGLMRTVESVCAREIDAGGKLADAGLAVEDLKAELAKHEAHRLSLASVMGLSADCNWACLLLAVAERPSVQAKERERLKTKCLRLEDALQNIACEARKELAR